jgi:tetratricopeptide (TPR) repeat protein
VTYQQMSRYEEALADFDRVIKLDPYRAWAIAGRGETYRRMGQFENALADLGRAIELDAVRDRHRYLRALTYLAMGNTGKGHADLAVAIQLAQERHGKEPENSSNSFNLALYHLASGEPEDVEGFYRRGLAGDASPHDICEAIRDLDDFLGLFPGHSEASALRDLLRDCLQRRER